MACSNPDLPHGSLCQPAVETFKKICKRCKWHKPPSQTMKDALHEVLEEQRQGRT